MRKKILVLGLFLLAVTAVFYLVSCKKEKVYSCNEEVNDYAKVNLKTNQTISRDNLAKMGIDTQFAIFNSLSSNNKARIMKEKIQLLLDMDTVPSVDKLHLKQISDYVTGAIYDNNIEDDSFINNWKTYAMETLQWDEIRLAVYLYTWLTPSEIFVGRNGSLGWDRANTDGGGGGYKPNCVCTMDWVCGSWKCTKDICTETLSGCGLLGWFRCTGDCKP